MSFSREYPNQEDKFIGRIDMLMRRVDELERKVKIARHRVVALGQSTNSIVSVVAAPALSTLTSTITFTGIQGRRYVLKYQPRAISCAGSSSIAFTPVIDGSVPAFWDSYYEGEGNYGSRLFEWEWIAPDNSAHTFLIACNKTSATVVNIYNQTSSNCYWKIMEEG